MLEKLIGKEVKVTRIKYFNSLYPKGKDCSSERIYITGILNKNEIPIGYYVSGKYDVISLSPLLEYNDKTNTVKTPDSLYKIELLTPKLKTKMLQENLLNRFIKIEKIADRERPLKPSKNKIGDSYTGKVVMSTPTTLIIKEKKLFFAKTLPFIILSFKSTDMTFESESSVYKITII